MRRADLLRAVGREPLFSTGMLLSPGVSLQGVRKQLSRWTADGTVVQVRRGLYALGYLCSHSGEPGFARDFRLQHLDSVDFERLATMAQRFTSRKVERFAGNVVSLARAEAEEYQDL